MLVFSHLHYGREDEEDCILQAEPAEDIDPGSLHIFHCEGDHDGGETKDEGHCKSNRPPVSGRGGEERGGEGRGGEGREGEGRWDGR